MKLLNILPFVAIAQSFVIPNEEILAEIVPTLKDKVSESYHQFLNGLKPIVENTIHDIHDIKDDVVDFLEKPHHPPHHREPNETLYEMINRSKYSTRLAKLINDDEELIDIFNSTKSNVTVFVPIDSAFEKFPDCHKISKEQIRKAILYHAIPGFYDARRVLRTHTFPTLLTVDTLSKKPVPQRLAVGLDIRRGFGLNYYARIKAANIFGTNGVAHAIDHILIPPPNAVRIVEFLVSEFTSLNLALSKTGLGKHLNDTDAHDGGTFFAPPESAWKRLGPRANAFLFSPRGLKYLKALLLYHLVPDHTLYTDAYYTAEDGDVHEEGVYHLDLPTGLHGKTIAVDVAKYGPWTEIKINAFSRITIRDGVARDGVIQDVSNVLIPPKKVSGTSEVSHYEGGEISVEDLVERLEPYVDHSEDENMEL